VVGWFKAPKRRSHFLGISTGCGVFVAERCCEEPVSVGEGPVAPSVLVFEDVMVSA
jgi:hypothetical protein